MEEESQKKEEVNTPIVETTSIIDKADAVAQRMEAANVRAEALLVRQEAIAARMMLGGKAEAGQVNKTPEQNEAEAIDKRVAETLKRFK